MSIARRFTRLAAASVAVVVVVAVSSAFAQSAAPSVTKGSFTDSRDKKVYKMVKIGSGQTWFAENLNYAAKGSKCYGEDGDVIIGIGMTEGLITDKLSNAEVQANCLKYGRLYDWSTALKACPAGTHLPSDAEWTALMVLVGGESTAGTKLKSTSGWGGTDNFGFSALPGGYGDSNDEFRDVDEIGAWWSATEYDARDAWERSMYDNHEDVKRFGNRKNGLYSVRCVQDANNTASAQSAVPSVKKGSFTDIRDKRVYKTVKIGNGKTWFAENLKYDAKGSKCYGESGVVTSYDKDGELITTKLSNAKVQANCAKYGRLYDWSTALKACPAGTHLPSDNEWSALIKSVGDESTAGTKLKFVSGWNYGNGTNEFGFSALPGGNGSSDGSFSNDGYDGFWWSATENYSDGVWGWNMHLSSDNVDRYHYGKSNWFSVRCVQD